MIAVDINRRRVFVKRDRRWYVTLKELWYYNFHMLAPYHFPVEAYQSHLMEIGEKGPGFVEVGDWTVEWAE
jgi:hypothetical protein